MFTLQYDVDTLLISTSADCSLAGIPILHRIIPSTHKKDSRNSYLKSDRYAIFDDKGKAVGTVSYATDVTEELRHSQAFPTTNGVAQGSNLIAEELLALQASMTNSASNEKARMKISASISHARTVNTMLNNVLATMDAPIEPAIHDGSFYAGPIVLDLTSIAGEAGLSVEPPVYFSLEVHPDTRLYCRGSPSLFSLLLQHMLEVGMLCSARIVTVKVLSMVGVLIVCVSWFRRDENPPEAAWHAAAVRLLAKKAGVMHTEIELDKMDERCICRVYWPLAELDLPIDPAVKAGRIERPHPIGPDGNCDSFMEFSAKIHADSSTNGDVEQSFQTTIFDELLVISDSTSS